jgi:hypothetical protein
LRPRYISDELLLKWINSGELRISRTWSRRPVLKFRGRKQKAELVVQRGRNYPAENGCARYTWRIQDGVTRTGRRRRRRIVCAKLVWMHCHRRCVPWGWFIHHADEKRLNDSIDNLYCLDKPAHDNVHYGDEEFVAEVF